MDAPPFPIPTAKAHQWVVYLTARCNFACDYCIQKGLIAPGAVRRPWARYDELSGAQWVQSLNALPVRPEHTLILTGGEPTIHRDFFEIATGLDGYRLDLTSNLSFDVGEFARRMRAAGKTFYSSFHTYHPKFMDAETFVRKALELRDSGVIENPVFSLLNLDEFPHFRDDEHDRNLDTFRDFATKLGLAFQRNEFRGNHMGAPFLHEDKHEMRCTSGWVNFAPNGDIHNCQYHLEISKNVFGNITDVQSCRPLPAFGEFFGCSDFGFCDPCHENSGRGAFQDAEGRIFRRTDHDTRVYLRWMDSERIAAVARKYLGQGQLDEARHALLTAIAKQDEEGKDSGEQASTWAELGLTLWSAGERDKALAAYLHAIELGLGGLDGLASCLQLARETGRQDEVRRQLAARYGPEELERVQRAVELSFV